MCTCMQGYRNYLTLWFSYWSLEMFWRSDIFSLYWWLRLYDNASSDNSSIINVREYQRGNEKWIIKINLQHRVQDEHKHNFSMCMLFNCSICFTLCNRLRILDTTAYGIVLLCIDHGVNVYHFKSHLPVFSKIGDRRRHDHTVVPFRTTYVIGAYNKLNREFEFHLWRGVLDTKLWDKVC
jgi:hypothetical protein